MAPIISIDNVSKRYLLQHEAESYTAMRDVIAERVKAAGRALLHPFAGQTEKRGEEQFWALKDVSFDIEPGDRVGIIGRNGAGKSTLLKILSRITEPTSGKVGINGRVASLLEVGTGFHPELTGRENIYLNGAILGMGRAEIKRKFDEIVAFAEVERFLDTPVKRYSSGMYVRLAFAVAAHLEPEILIVDEVLAVGDAQFQKKCLGKMKDVGKEGRTVLFVTHNMTAVRALCSKAAILSAGRLAYTGDVEKAISHYLQISAEELSFHKSWEFSSAPGNENVRLRSIRIVPADDTDLSQLSVRNPFNIEIEYWNLKEDAVLSFSMHVTTPEEVIAFATTTWCEENYNNKPFKTGLYRSSCFIPGGLLNTGPYRLRFFFVVNGKASVCKIDDVFSFELLDTIHDRGGWHGKWDGVVRPNLKWWTEAVEEGIVEAAF